MNRSNIRCLKFIICIVSVAFIICPDSAAQQKISPDTLQIDYLVEMQMDNWKVPGCAVAVVKGKDLLFAKGYGWRDIEKKLPVTPNTIFKIASCTKSFTAAAAGLLVSKGLLEWDEPVKNYLPELEFISKDLTNQVTLKDLLSHRTGLYDDDWSWVGDHIDKKRMYEILSVMPQQKPFRSSYIYSNMTYALAGVLIAEAGKDSWRNIIRKNFFEPLSLSSSVFSHDENSGDDFAYGYEYPDTSEIFIRGNLSEHYTDSLSVCESFGFISSSVRDLSVWVQLFINCGEWEGKQIIPREIIKELVRPINYMGDSPYPEIKESFYCMGWFRNQFKGHTLIQHSGGLAGFKSYMSFMPEDSIGIIVLTNGQPYSFPLALTYDLYDIILGFPQTLFLDKFLTVRSSSYAETKNNAANITGTSPSKPLPEYEGVYHSKWLGNIRIVFENDGLFFHFHNYPVEKMIHAHYNTFFTGNGRKQGEGITFRLDHDGNIVSLLLNEFIFEKINPE